jgi:hypothetical protein
MLSRGIFAQLISHIVIETIRRRAKEAAEAEIVAGLKRPPE